MALSRAKPRHARDPRAPAPHRAQLWTWARVAALIGTVPAFYAELVSEAPPPWPAVLYLGAALVLAAALVVPQAVRPADTAHSRALDAILVLGLLAAALLPASSQSQPALVLRLLVAFLTLLAMVLRLRHHVTRGGVVYLLLWALGVLLLCGAGFWWLEPRTPTLADGLWLAFTTAATVGYGDIVPSTTASRIFPVFVVMLGYGVLSLATAALATSWIETEERSIEREILRDLHQRLGALHDEIHALKAELQQRAPPPS
jgi:voltage-gated potassium channel